MAIKDLMTFLYTEAIGTTDPNGNIIRNQDDFADKWGVKRETFNQWTTGKQMPNLSKIKEIVEGEGHDINDCIEVPVTARAKAQAAYPALFRDLEEIVLSGDETRIGGIEINLRDIAAGARASKKSQKRALGKQERETLRPKMRKKKTAAG